MEIIPILIIIGFVLLFANARPPVPPATPIIYIQTEAPQEPGAGCFPAIAVLLLLLVLAVLVLG